MSSDNRNTFGAPASNNAVPHPVAPIAQRSGDQGGPGTVTPQLRVNTPENTFHVRATWQTGVRPGAHNLNSPTDGPNRRNIVQPSFRFPPSSFSPEQRLQNALINYAGRSGWPEVTNETVAKISFMLLTGSLPCTLSLKSDIALDILDTVIQWNGTVRNNSAWTPTEVVISYVDNYTPAFSTNRNDRTFCKLLREHLSLVPLIFFNHVRESIKRLMVPARIHNDSSRSYPRHVIPGYSTNNRSHSGWIQNRLNWDARWGYNLWHVEVNESSEFQVWWFADRSVREIFLHTLRLSNSIGSFAIEVPQDYGQEVPCTVQTLSFVFTALCVELEGIAHLTSCDTIIEYIERFKTLQVVVFSFLTSINERSNGHLNEQQSNAAYLGLQSVLQLVDLNNVVADHATVSTIVISP